LPNCYSAVHEVPFVQHKRTTASCGFSATARLSCIGLHQRPFKCWNYTNYADFHSVIATLVWSCTVSEILQFLCFWPHPNSTLILGVFPLHQIAHVGVNVSRGLKLFGHEIIFEIFQPVLKTYLNVTDGRTDRQTDDMQSHNSALHLDYYYYFISTGITVPRL